jgi:hypothetical protein
MMLVLTNVCIVDTTPLPGAPPIRLMLLSPSISADWVTLATLVPGEIQHAAINFQVPGGTLENRGRAAIHIAGYTGSGEQPMGSEYEEEDADEEQQVLMFAKPV